MELEPGFICQPLPVAANTWPLPPYLGQARPVARHHEIGEGPPAPGRSLVMAALKN